MHPNAGPDLTRRETTGLVLYLLGLGLGAMILAHDLVDFGWMVLVGGTLIGALAGAVGLSPFWAGGLAGAVAGVVATLLTQGFVALTGKLEMGAFHPRMFFALTIPLILAFVPGFVVYVFLRKMLGLPLRDK
jgi:hypothetical protein